MTTKELKPLKINRFQLRTPANYAKDRGVHPVSVKRWIKKGELKTEEIDGIVFVKLTL